MNEFMNGAANVSSMMIGVVVVMVILITGFLANRARLRASEQIRLLEALLAGQKEQNIMLRRLMERIAGDEKNTPADDEDNKDFTRLIPER